MSRHLLVSLGAAGLLLAGCSTVSSTLDTLNPFSGSSAKLPPLPASTAAAEPRTLWSAGIGKAGDYTFVPAPVGNAVFVAARDGSVAKLVDGKTAWKVDVGQPISSGVGANERLFVVGTPKGEVLAFSAENGKPLWKAKASSEILAAPALGEDGVAVRSGDNRVFLFDAADGSRKWVYQRSTPVLSIRGATAPVFSDRYVFVGFPGGKLVALALANGAPVWEGTVALPKGATELDRVADIVALPVVDGRQICAVAFQGRVACFDLGQSGTMVWSREISSTLGLALDGQALFVADDSGVVHALDRNSGSSLWKQDKLKGRSLSAPVVSQGMVAVADGEGILHFLSKEDGSFVGRQKTDGSPVRTPPLSFNGNVLVQTVGGTVAAIEAR